MRKMFSSGTYENNHMDFDNQHSELRTDANFRQRLQEGHHKLSSQLEKLTIDMIIDIPLEY